MKTKNLILFTSLLFISACAQTPTAPAISAAAQQETAVAEAWVSLGMTQTASAPTVTFTPLPPTNTPQPTVTSTPAPQPIILTGTGDSVVDVPKWNGVALMKATYNSGSNFIVGNFNSNGDQIDFPINTIGAYSGTQMIDIYDDDDTTRLQVTASGPWEIQILPLDSIRIVNVPGVIQGVGDDVVLLNGNDIDILIADASQASSNFIVHTLSSSSGFDVAFNEIAPYTGTVIVNSSTNVIQVKAEGPWSIEVKTK